MFGADHVMINFLSILYRVVYFSIYMLQEKLREAAKAQLRRMCTKHKTRKDLDPPEWVVREYKSRPQKELADLLIKCNFNRAALFRFIDSISFPIQIFLPWWCLKHLRTNLNNPSKS